jgi:two-component system, chemotaxis family, sensor kinase CheA
MKKNKGRIPEPLEKAIDQLATRAMAAKADDVIVLGSILEHLETIEKLSRENGYPAGGALIQAVRKLVEKIVLGEAHDPPKALVLLGRGVHLIQGKILHPDVSQPTQEETAFWEALVSLIPEEKPSLSPKKKTRVGEPGGPAAGKPQETVTDFGQDMDLCKDFVSEALERLETIELQIINLEQSPDDKECIHSIFRSFHTIKGVSGFLNLKEITQFSHAMESLLDEARNGRLQIQEEIIDFILEAVDVLKTMILELKEQMKSGRIQPPSIDLSPYLRKIERMKRGEAVFPTAIAGKSEVPPLGEILSQKGIISAEDIEGALRIQREGKKDRKIGEILIRENKVKPREVIEALQDQKKFSPQPGETAVRVDTNKLDSLVDLIEELVIAQSLVAQNPIFSSLHDPKLSHDFSQFRRITADLRRISLSLRMVPIRHTFQKMIRLVRDLAKKSNKEVDLILSGDNTEIDRNLVETLYDPLVHMIRNSVDHGIEPPAKRSEAGKPQRGNIFLRAFHKGGYIVIEVEDDGQGLNRPKILKKAREKGLVPEDAPLTDHQIDNLIFEPGFSTAAQITDVSGRGVGMDVVRKTIEKLKGNVEIFSVTGKGCRFILRVPLTLAIMDGIVVQIGKERYIIPTVFIRETLRPCPTDLKTVQNRGELIKVRDTFLPLIRLSRTLGIQPQQEQPWEALVVVVENEGRQQGLLVDDLLGKQEVVIKNLGEHLKNVEGVAGATILGDGRVGLILDIHGIFEMSLHSPMSAQA